MTNRSAMLILVTVSLGSAGVARGGATCPAATILSADPPAGTVDARQPHVPNDPAALLGIGGAGEPIIIDLNVPGAPATCFTLCETAQDASGPNAVATVVDNGDGTYTIGLDRPITSNAVTTISYDDGSFVEYISHPGNVNADSVANSVDVLTLINIANGVEQPPYGEFSADIDHSGVTSAPDVLRAIDLLNGAAGYSAQLLTLLPELNGLCPPPATGSIVAWGFNGSGQVDTPNPNSGFVQISTGGNHNLALRADGSIEAWGWDV